MLSRIVGSKSCCAESFVTPLPASALREAALFADAALFVMTALFALVLAAGSALLAKCLALITAGLASNLIARFVCIVLLVAR